MLLMAVKPIKNQKSIELKTFKSYTIRTKNDYSKASTVNRLIDGAFAL
jgi:hypothetical protein